MLVLYRYLYKVIFVCYKYNIKGLKCGLNVEGFRAMEHDCNLCLRQLPVACYLENKMSKIRSKHLPD